MIHWYPGISSLEEIDINIEANNFNLKIENRSMVFSRLNFIFEDGFTNYKKFYFS